MARDWSHSLIGSPLYLPTGLSPSLIRLWPLGGNVLGCRLLVPPTLSSPSLPANTQRSPAGSPGRASRGFDPPPRPLLRRSSFLTAEKPFPSVGWFDACLEAGEGDSGFPLSSRLPCRTLGASLEPRVLPAHLSRIPGAGPSAHEQTVLNTENIISAKVVLFLKAPVPMESGGFSADTSMCRAWLGSGRGRRAPLSSDWLPMD